MKRFELPNGMKVIYSQRMKTDGVAVCLYYLIGGRNDPLDMIGGTFLFQDLMFQGTDNIEPLDHVFFVNQKGGRIGGRVNHDRAFFFQVLPHTQLDLALRYESERLRGLKLDNQVIENQKRLVLNRINRAEGNIFIRAASWIQSQALKGSAYETAVHGDPARLRMFSPERVRDFYSNFQNISNLILMVTGRFDEDELKQLVSRYFQDFPGGYRSRNTFNPVQLEKISVFKNWAIDQLDRPFCIYGFRVPARLSGDYFQIDFLKYYLADPRFSRLEYVLNQENHLGIEISAEVTDHFEGNVLFIQLNAPSRTNLEKAKYIMDRELESMQNVLISATDIRMVKSAMEMDFLKRLNTLEERALAIAEYYHMFSSLDFFDTDLQRIRKIDSYDIRNAVLKYIRRDFQVMLNVYASK